MGLFLLKLKDRIDRVGLDIPTIEVRYEHLNIEAEAFVGSKALPSFINFATNVIKSHKLSLHGLARMTLLLGPPSSGKTTLLLALSGKLDSSLQRTVAYISQHDVHIGEMTVRETLAFSARCQGVGSRYDMLSKLSRREKAANIKPDPDVDVYMKILGLNICADTMVGDEMLRGISRGQRKRVTTGEMLVGPANALFMDEISIGLDSSTTFQIVSSLRQYVHILNGTAVTSLLQPAPETYDLFDDIILISDGQVVYHGPREYVLDFFESMGFRCPERKSVADFLQEVTSKKDQAQYWVRRDQPYRFVIVSDSHKILIRFIKDVSLQTGTQYTHLHIGDDSLAWDGVSDGSFTMASTYSSLDGLANLQHNSLFCDIWRWKGP
ncbi:P-loop containing nucleoside triphosphate hydrolase [Sesbania bispinosa]|nr:P-loop containing nucleoside triphosphate hydrolase [Sesbania bispinosa]